MLIYFNWPAGLTWIRTQSFYNALSGSALQMNVMEKAKAIWKILPAIFDKLKDEGGRLVHRSGTR